jgi:Carboxypeptidase regulatory-like domain/TonB dependent receptor
MTSIIAKLSARAIVIASMTVMLALPAFAQTTARLNGTVVDAQGAVLPGVTVTVTSPQLLGANVTVTDGGGQFFFPSLPPGTYHVKAELSGFKTTDQDGVRILLDQTITLPLKMSVAGVAEVVNVTASTPVVDTTSTAGGINVGQEIFDQLAVKRDIYDLTRLAPGVTHDTFGPTFYGSTSAENSYIIDGMNTTGVDTGTEGKQLNTDFIQEVQVQTGGLNAEYGRMTGGNMNIITKSGGNQFHTDLFAFGQGGGLQAANTTATQLPKTSTSVTNTSHLADYGGDLGGFLVKDKVWFFGAYDRVDQRDDATIIAPLTTPGSPALGSAVPADIAKNLFAAKVTFKASQNHTLTFTTFGDPNTRTGAIFTTQNGLNFSVNGPPSTWQGTLNQGGTDTVGKYDGIFGAKTLISGMIGQHRESQQYGGAGLTVPYFTNNTVNPTQASGGFQAFDNQDFKRTTVKGDLTHYMGDHTLKAGGDYEDVNATVDRYQGGAGQHIYELVSGGTIYYRHRYYVNDLAPGYVRADPSTWTINLPLEAKPETKNASFYAQDGYKPISSLTLNYGVRWEKQQVIGRDPTAGFSLNNNWAGRFGVIWDPTNTGKSKLYFNYGRFYENIPQDINIRSFGGELTAFSYNFSPDAANYLPVSGTPGKNALLGGPEAADPNLKGQYIDEYIGGFEYEVAPKTTASVRYIYRNLGRVIEDFLVPSSGEYFVANPGQGTLGQTLAFYDGVHTAPSPQATRTNNSLEFSVKKRYSDNWQLLASYVYSKLDGNYDGTFQQSTGQLDPNINSAFDYADFLVNAQGELSNEHKNQLKLDGSYVVNNHGALDGLSLGLSFHWLSGVPLTAFGYSQAYANWEYYLTPRGSLGYGPADYETDLHVNYPIKLGNAKANVVLNVFNLLNRQAPTVLDQRYNLVSDGPCAGVGALCNGDGGLVTTGNSLTPLGQLANPRATATNPDFLKAGTFFTLPRSAQIGVRFTF